MTEESNLRPRDLVAEALDERYYEMRKKIKKKCKRCGKLVPETSLYGDGVCRQCIEKGRPPFE